MPSLGKPNTDSVPRVKGGLLQEPVFGIPAEIASPLTGGQVLSRVGAPTPGVIGGSPLAQFRTHQPTTTLICGCWGLSDRSDIGVSYVRATAEGESHRVTSDHDFASLDILLALLSDSPAIGVGREFLVLPRHLPLQ